MPDMGVLGLEFENNIVIFEISSFIYLTAKFREKIKMPKFENKNALFGYFWARISKNYFHIWKIITLEFV